MYGRVRTSVHGQSSRAMIVFRPKEFSVPTRWSLAVRAIARYNRSIRSTFNIIVIIIIVEDGERHLCVHRGADA
jgi:hypothetical protein